MRRTSSTHERNVKRVHISLRKLHGKRQLRISGIDGRIILKWITEKYGVDTGVDISVLRIWSNGRFF
jgi:hypothetical protein